MRILIDYRPALRQRSGVGEYVHQLSQALAGGDRSVTLFSSSWKDRVQRTGLADMEVVDRRVPVQVLNLLWHRFQWPTVERLTGRTFDVVHSAHPLLMPASRGAQVVTIHDLDFLTHPERTRAEIRRDYPGLAQSHARRADRILVPSGHTARQVERLLGIDVARISVCPHGAPAWPPRSGPPTEGYILFLGTLEPRKNIGALLDAYARLIARYPTAPPLVLAGAATEAARPWLARLREPPLAGRARHAGYVQPDERQALYAGASMLVMPSFDEGFGLTVLEALTMGVPVVAANRGALPEVLGDAGLAVDPDEESLAAAMERLIADEAFAQACAAKGVLRARQFTWRATADAVLAGYQEAIASRARRGQGAER